MVLFAYSARAGARIFLVLAILFIYSSHLYAAPVVTVAAQLSVPPVEEARYKIYWNGIRLGKLWFYWKEDGEHYEAQAKIQTSGVARVFSKNDRTASVTGHMARKNGMEYYFPEKYDYISIGKRKTRKVAVDYDENALVKDLSISPPDDPKRRKPVAEDTRNAASDPLTGLRAILHYVQTFAQGGVDSSRSFTVFDGRQLTKIVAVAGGSSKRCGEGCVIARGSRELLEGYTEEEIAKFKDKEDVVIVMEFYPSLSRFPKRISADTMLGEVYAKRY